MAFLAKLLSCFLMYFFIAKKSSKVLIFCTVEVVIPAFMAFSLISLISKTIFSASKYCNINSSRAKNLSKVLFATVFEKDICALISLLSASILCSLKILMASITSSFFIPKISLRKSTLESASTPRLTEDLLLKSELSILLAFSF